MNSTKQVYAFEGKEMLKNVCFYDQQLTQSGVNVSFKSRIFFSNEEGLIFFILCQLKRNVCHFFSLSPI